MADVVNMYNFDAELDESLKKDVKFLKHRLAVETNSELLEKLIIHKKEQLLKEFAY